MVTSADIAFSRELHEYRLPTGQRVPGVTEILSSVGVSMNFEGLASLGRRVADAIELKREIGHALHADAHSFDDNDLDWATVDPRVEPYLRAWATFRENTGVVPTTRERRVYHNVYGYAGTLDGIFRTTAGRLVLIDLKTGDPDDSGCAYQTAAYLAAYRLEHVTEEYIERWAVRLTPDHGVPYRITPYTAWDDFHKFQAFLTTFHHQAERRQRRAA